MLSFLSVVEAAYLRKFFDGVDFAVSQELRVDEIAYEEALTPLLGKLLDWRSPFQRLLEYPLRSLNDDLQQCGGGHHVRVEFETVEHAKGYSGKVSHADLGIILRYENKALGEQVEKAILVECKRLYTIRREYKLASRYEGFDASQFQSLKKLVQLYGDSSVYYFLYNPVLEAFVTSDAQLIRGIENRLFGNGFHSPKDPRGLKIAVLHALLRASGFGAPVPPTLDPAAARNAMNIWSSRRPGLRVMSLTSLDAITSVGSSAKLALADCYRYLHHDQWRMTDGAVPFSPLSSFLVDFVMACIRGSTAPGLIEMASGRAPNGEDNPDRAATVLARHVLRVNITSGLPTEEALLLQR